MKLKNRIVFNALMFLILSFAVQAQDLSEYEIVAEYSLQNTAKDLSGNYSDITLENVPYHNQNGVYSNGKYIHSGEDGGCLIETPKILEINQGNFAVSVEVKTDSVESGINSILVLGSTWRYLGIERYGKAEYSIIFNGNRTRIHDLQVKDGEWLRFSIVYSQEDSMTSWYIDDTVIHSESGKLNYDTLDTSMSNTHFGDGYTLKGFMRNLIVYSKNTKTSQYEKSIPTTEIAVLGNPIANGQIVVEKNSLEPCIYQLFNQYGKIKSKGVMLHSVHTIITENLNSGIYFLVINDPKGTHITTEKIIIL